MKTVKRISKWKKASRETPVGARRWWTCTELTSEFPAEWSKQGRAHRYPGGMVLHRESFVPEANLLTNRVWPRPNMSGTAEVNLSSQKR